MAKESKTIFDRNVIDFVTVAAEFCKLMEQAVVTEKDQFVDTTLKVLPLLYIKALLLPACEPMGNELLEEHVTEEDYEYIRTNIARILTKDDVYLDVFMEDMKYSDTPVRRCISEDLADIYQALRNFVESYKSGLDDVMAESVAVCAEGFRTYWGQTLANTMRAVHNVRYGVDLDPDYE